jgi:hypothetical protein
VNSIVDNRPKFISLSRASPKFLMLAEEGILRRKGNPMKRCALCHRTLGLGVRFRNIWNGGWWIHVQFCSVRCKAIYEVKRKDAAKNRWHTFLARSNSRS